MSRAGSSSDSTTVDATIELQRALERSRLELDVARLRISELQHSKSLLTNENRILGMSAQGRPLPEILDAHCRGTEALLSGSIGEILLLAQPHRCVEHSAAPGLPHTFQDAIRHRMTSSEAGPSSIAVSLRDQVIVSDISSDPRWDTGDWRSIALVHGLRACCSTPIIATGGEVLGSLTMYWREPRNPSEQELALIGRSTQLAATVIERSRTESALRASEIRFRQMADSIPEVIWFTELNPEQVLYVSPNFEHVWGVPTAELYRNPRRWAELIHPDDRERVAGIFSRWIGGEAINYHDIEFRIVKPDGETRWIHERGTLAVDASGTPCLASGISTDITERKQTEQKLLRSESSLTEAIDTIPGLVWSVLPDGEVDFLNRRWREYTGLTLEQARGWGWRAAIHTDDLPGLETYWRSVLTSGKPGETEARLRRFDGTFRWFLFRAVPLYDDAGKPLKWYGQNTDIDDRKCAEEAMRATRARFAGILDIAEDAIISVDSAQRIVLFNQGAEKVFGYAPGEVTGRPLDMLLPDRFAFTHKGHIAAFGRSTEVSRLMGQRREVFGRRKDGSEFPAEASISKLDLGGELTFTVILRDITERKLAAEALHASEHLARGQLEALTDTLAALSHESEPEKLLEHVLKTIGCQLQAHSLGVYEFDDGGRLRLITNCEGGCLLPATPNETQAAPTFGLATQPHPIWTEFFRTGAHCVIGDLQPDGTRVRLADVPDSPWYDWLADTVVTPTTEAVMKRLRSIGVVSTLAVPTFIAGKVAGLISIRFREQREFRKEEIELTRALTHQAMLAIRLIRLSQQSREAAVAAERNRMARDMHDTLAQGFTGVIMQLEAAKGAIAKADVPSVAVHVERAGTLARSSLGEARRTVRAMRSQSLVDGTLCTALSELLKSMVSGTELQAELVVEGGGRPIAPDREEGLLRIAQESLTNTIKHAHASHFHATLTFATDSVRLQLTDNGRGFDSHAEHDGFGLIGMKERAEQMAGTFVLRSRPSQGTEIVIELTQTDVGNGGDEDHQA